MIRGNTDVVVMPAYNAEKTLEMTYREIPMDIGDEVILTDDSSHDKTVESGQALGIKHVFVHQKTGVTGATKKPVTSMPCR